jgi:hypothetical protein
MTGIGAVAAWTGPALVVAVVGRVTGGGVEAPLLVLAALAAPLLGLLLAAPEAGSAPRGRVALAIVLVTAACVLGAGFRVITDLGRVLGVEPHATLGAAAALVLAATVWPGRRRVAASALGLGAAALLIATVLLGVSAGAPPWTVWGRVASRGAFELGSRSAWVQEGALVLEPTTLTFTEPHRVTAVTADVYRVAERDRAPITLREWRLSAGDSLALRPGDQLSIPAGARVRFETGKRVPGAPVSGVAWADRPGASTAGLLAGWLGLTVTLTGGALVLVRPVAPPSRASALLAPVILLTVVLAAALWGVYAVDAAPELSIGAPPAASFAGLPAAVAGPGRARFLGVTVVALGALLVASASALRQRLADLAEIAAGRPGSWARRPVIGIVAWPIVVGAAAAGSTWIADGWWLFLQGAGLAAASFLGPLVAAGGAAGAKREGVAGVLAGAGLFAVITAGASWLAPLSTSPAAVVTQYPALVAAPTAWLVAALARAVGREKVAAARRR